MIPSKSKELVEKEYEMIIGATLVGPIRFRLAARFTRIMKGVVMTKL